MQKHLLRCVPVINFNSIIRPVNTNANANFANLKQRTDRNIATENRDRDSKSKSAESSPVKASKTTDYCLQLVKRHDYDNFLATLLIPDARLRTAVFALRSFNCEVALIRDQVSQAEIGIGRFVFWKDAVKQLFKAADNAEAVKTLPRHPVIQELLMTVFTADNLSQKWFHNLIDSREQVLNDNPYATLAELEKYADQSVTPVLYLGFEFMNIKNLNLDHCASHLGKAIGLTNFIRGLPFNSQRRRVLVPQELIIKHKVSQENFIRLDEPSKIHDVVYDIAASAHLHYRKAESLKDIVEKELKKNSPAISPFTILLSAAPSDIYLKKLEKYNFNPYDPKLVGRNNLLPFQLYYRKLTKQYF